MTFDQNDSPEAIELRAPHGSREMEIDWADGHQSRYSHRILRGYCPCANCQGHHGPIEFVEGGNLELSDIGEVGNYALRLTWADGHNTGIYSFRYLRSLCECSHCSEVPIAKRQLKK